MSEHTLRSPDRSPLATPRGAGAVLTDELPGDRVRDLLLVLAYILLTGLSAQAAVTLDATPVPLSAQSFTVLAGAALLGWRRALTGMVLYALAGLVGVPWFTHFTGGPEVLLDETFGYVLGLVIASMVVGGLAARAFDRSPPTAAVMIVLGRLVTYAFALPWLMASLGVGLGEGLAMAVTPFLVTDLLAVVVAAVLLPGVWRVTHRARPEGDSS